MLLQLYIQYLTLTVQLLIVSVPSLESASTEDQNLEDMNFGKPVQNQGPGEDTIGAGSRTKIRNENATEPGKLLHWSIKHQSMIALSLGTNTTLLKDFLIDNKTYPKKFSKESLEELGPGNRSRFKRELDENMESRNISLELASGDRTKLRLVSPGEMPISYRKQQEIKLIRKRRALNFPEGTTLQFGVCYFPFVVGTHGLFNFGITLGSNWDVPANPLKYKYPVTSRSRRERRSLYPKIESILTRLGLHGEHCVLHTLCHLAHRRRNKSPGRPSFLSAVLGVLFHYPPSRDAREPEDHYDSATGTRDCEKFEKLCPELSLVLALIGQL